MMPLDGASAKRALRNAAHLGRIPIMHAALQGDLDLFNVVLKEMRMRLNEDEVTRGAFVSCFNHVDKDSRCIFPCLPTP